MRNFQDTFETRKRLFISAFSICMTVPLIETRKAKLLQNFLRLLKSNKLPYSKLLRRKT